METTIKLDKNLQQRLSIRCAELSCTQQDLIIQYILNGLMEDYMINSPIDSLEDIRKLLKNDAPEGNGLEKIDGIFKIVESNR